MAPAAMWRALMLRAFSIDVLTCPYSGGLRALIAFLTAGMVVRKILAHLGLPTEAPRIAPAQEPPGFEFAEGSRASDPSSSVLSRLGLAELCCHSHEATPQRPSSLRNEHFSQGNGASRLTLDNP